VQGWQLDQKLGRGLARAFYSQEKAITRLQSIPVTIPVAPSSSRTPPSWKAPRFVKVNEQVQKFGVDYRLDYDSGQLWFETEGNPPKIIPGHLHDHRSAYQSSSGQSSEGHSTGRACHCRCSAIAFKWALTLLKQGRGGTAGARHRRLPGGTSSTARGPRGPSDVNFHPIVANGTQSRLPGQGPGHLPGTDRPRGTTSSKPRRRLRLVPLDRPDHLPALRPPTAMVIIRYYLRP